MKKTIYRDSESGLFKFASFEAFIIERLKGTSISQDERTGDEHTSVYFLENEGVVVKHETSPDYATRYNRIAKVDLFGKDQNITGVESIILSEAVRRNARVDELYEQARQTQKEIEALK